MDIFNLNLPEEENEDDKKFPKLDAWFDFMNEQMEKLEESQQKARLNKLLNDNDIHTL